MLDPKSSVLKQIAAAMKIHHPKVSEFKNRIKSFESDCYSENFSGRVVLNDENTGKFLLLGNYSNGLPDGDFIIGSSDGPSEKFLFKEGKLVEFCSTRINALDFTQTKRPSEILADSRTPTKPPKERPFLNQNQGFLALPLKRALARIGPEPSLFTKLSF